jgi:predicted nucleic acid-binding protein
VDANILVHGVLCSEDMQHNQAIEGVRIFNPLLA